MEAWILKCRCSVLMKLELLWDNSGIAISSGADKEAGDAITSMAIAETIGYLIVRSPWNNARLVQVHEHEDEAAFTGRK